MTKIAIVFFSGSGTTRQVAQHVQNGVESAGAQACVVEIVGADITEGRWANDELAATLDGCDGIIIGTPTYMGGVSAQVKAFFDAMAPRWYTQAWDGKVAGAFTVSAKASGDKLNCLQDILTFAMQMGMHWVGTGIGAKPEFAQNGVYLGLGATAQTPEAITEEDQITAIHHGHRIAATAATMQNTK